MPAPRTASSISGQTFSCALTYSSALSGRTRSTNALRSVTLPPSPAFSSQLFVGTLDRSGAAPARECVSVSSVAERRDGVVVDAEPLSQTAEQRTDVGLERLEQDPVAAEHVSRQLRVGQPLFVDEQRLRIRRLDVHDGLDHRVDLPLDVVRLV